MKIEEIAVKDIEPFKRNAKKHDDRQINNVTESIKQFGFVQPIVIDKNNVVIIGHCRLLAAKRLKLKTVPIYRAEDLTEEQVNKLRLLDNKLNESEWDLELLAEDIPTLNWDGFDIDWGLQEDEEDIDIIEADVPEEVESRCKLGDVYILGDHRLICADSTSIEQINNLMGGGYS